MQRFGITRVGHWDAKLCTSCSEALQSGNSGVLYNAQQPIERTPRTCPLCAIEEFFGSKYQTSFDQVDFEFESNHKGRTLDLTFTFGRYMKFEELSMVPVRCK
jgi:hypothetical protein